MITWIGRWLSKIQWKNYWIPYHYWKAVLGKKFNGTYMGIPIYKSDNLVSTEPLKED